MLNEVFASVAGGMKHMAPKPVADFASASTAATTRFWHSHVEGQHERGPTITPAWLVVVVPVLNNLVFMSRDSLQGVLCHGPYPSYPCFLLIRGAHRVTNLLLRFVGTHTHVPIQFDCRWACGEHRRCPIWRPSRRPRKSKGCSCPYVHTSICPYQAPCTQLADFSTGRIAR